jgi:hypothetical protein
VHLRLPDAVITFRSAALAALTGSPLQRAAGAVFASGVNAAAGFSAMIVLLSLAIEARDRDLALARLAVMGLSAGQARRMILLEALPAVLAAGAVCGWALAPLTGSALDLSVFTGGTATVPVRVDAGVLVIPSAGLVVLVRAVPTAGKDQPDSPADERPGSVARASRLLRPLIAFASLRGRRDSSPAAEHGARHEAGARRIVVIEKPTHQLAGRE